MDLLVHMGVILNKDEALRLALEALKTPWNTTYVDGCDLALGKKVKAITAIKEALAQTEPNYKKALEVWLDKTEWVQETVKPHELGMHRADVLKQRIEEASLQRTWVGLTDEDIGVCLDVGNGSMGKIISAIEVKLKEKNG
jgi:hypothetical protein